ncbi:MAG TPA: septal ring lytic transglycosylase RlpA family protein [Flavobacterium sp.]|nr:septal ring lytic transglycosylase RlpA family protein [Flavobacterium sp.]
MRNIANYIIVSFTLLLGFVVIYSFIPANLEKESNIADTSEKHYLAMADSLEVIAEKQEEIRLSEKIEDLNQSLFELEEDVEVLYSTTRASYYHNKFNGRKTANGEIFDNNRLTAAHKTLPFGTKVKVTNLANDKSVIVTINDRGPYIKGRKIDLSKAAFKAITTNNSTRKGILRVKIEKLPDGYEETREELLTALEELETVQQLKKAEDNNLKEFLL